MPTILYRQNHGNALALTTVDAAWEFIEETHIIFGTPIIFGGLGLVE